MRMVGEVDFGATERDWLEWQRYESVINEALADWPLWGLCVFDTRGCPRRCWSPPSRTHPTLVRPDGRRPRTRRFVDPAAYLRGAARPDEPLEATPPAARARRTSPTSPACGTRSPPSWPAPAPTRTCVEDFLLAVDEMVSNAVRHGRPPVEPAAVDRDGPDRVHHRRRRPGLGRPVRRLRPRARRRPVPRRHGPVARPPAVRPRRHLRRGPAGDGRAVRLTVRLD